MFLSSNVPGFIYTSLLRKIKSFLTIRKKYIYIIRRSLLTYRRLKMTVVKRYKCRVCTYIYSPLRGEPHNGIPAGTAFEDLPENYVCPICGYAGEGEDWKMGV